VGLEQRFAEPETPAGPPKANEIVA